MDRTQARLSAPRVVFVIVALVVFALDRITKSIVAANVPQGTEISVIGQVVGITNIDNSGAAFGFAPGGTRIFAIASIIVAIGLAIYVARNPGGMWTDAVLGLIMGGTVGNGIDRLILGTVTDFINVHIWPVFNVADSAVTVGVVALLAGYVLFKPRAAA